MNAVAINCMPIPSAKGSRSFDVPGPRYATYPIADRFVEAFTADQLSHALLQRSQGAAAMLLPLALYVHIPFCESLCYHCACNKIITKRHEHGAIYLRYLSREVDLYTSSLGVGQTVSQLHLGGGTPTFLTDPELRELMAMLRRNFSLVPGGEYSIEVDLRTIDVMRLATLAELGFNRLSFGVQDFDPVVQKAIHRIQPTDGLLPLVKAARSLGFESVNIDLMYGLPQQTLESFECTLAQLVQLRPDRVALHAYSHQPHRFKSQRRFRAADLPPEDVRLEMLTRARSVLEQSAYVYLGMEHFALVNDPLSVAMRQGRLHRSFEGYSVRPDCDQISLGMSAIGRMGTTYSQNARTLEAYYDDLDQGHLPVVRGLSLSRDDMVRRSVIMALMCQGQLEFESIDLGHLIDFKSYFAPELEALRSMQAQGLVEVSETSIQVTEAGHPVVSTLVMVFDRYLQADRARARFSQII